MTWQQLYDHMDECERFELLMVMFKRIQWARFLDAYDRLPLLIRDTYARFLDRRLFPLLYPAHWVR